MLVFGTRPEAIKMAPLVKEFQKHTDSIKTITCVTGQHREMLDQVLQLFEIHPDYDLNIMKQEQDLYDITAKVMIGMRNVLTEAKPGVVFTWRYDHKHSGSVSCILSTNSSRTCRSRTSYIQYL